MANKSRFVTHDFCITMDYDSGYISHNTESNLDSSLESNLNDVTVTDRPIYLSEDALLEQPKITQNSKTERNPEISDSNITFSPSSSESNSEEIYGALLDSPETDESVVIPIAEPITFEVSMFKNEQETQKIDENMSQQVNMFEYAEPKPTALNNITNTPLKPQNQKKITLIFSKVDKENTYSVKRKYQSLSPNEQSMDQIQNEQRCNTSYDSSEHNNSSTTEQCSLSTSYESTSTEQSSMNISYECSNRDSNVTERKSVNTSMSTSYSLNESYSSMNTERSFTNASCVSMDISCNFLENDSMNKACSKKTSSMNKDQSTNSNLTPQKRPKVKNPNFSPDLFADDQETLQTPNVPIAKERYITKNDRKFLNKVSNSLKGVLPPYSVTVVRFTVEEMLERIHGNFGLFVGEPNSAIGLQNEPIGRKTILLDRDEPLDMEQFPQILEKRWHGLHHNRSKISERSEDLCTKYGERYVGAETQSTCTVFESSSVVGESSRTARRSASRCSSSSTAANGLKSPGRRLSHLARRRITFGGGGGAVGAQSVLQASSSFAASRARQILVDARKLDVLKKKRSPNKKTPSKSKRTPKKGTPGKQSRSPSDSAKKKLAMRFRKLAGEIEKSASNPNTSGSSSKRALFQSPKKSKLSSNDLNPDSESEIRRPTKRALFMSPTRKSPFKSSPLKYSPFKKSPFKRLLDVQRTRTATITSSAARITENPVGEMSAAHKKKLQWAVYEALNSQNVRPTHPHYKLFASQLARVTRRLLPHHQQGHAHHNNQPITTAAGGGVSQPGHAHHHQIVGGGTTETMLRIAKRHAYAVTKTRRSVDEIVGEYLRGRARRRQAPPQSASSIQNGGIFDNKGSFRGFEKSDFEPAAPFSKVGSEVMKKADRIKKVIDFGG